MAEIVNRWSGLVIGILDDRRYDLLDSCRAGPQRSGVMAGPFTTVHWKSTRMSYIAPVKEMLFAMQELADLERVAALPGFEDAGLDCAQAVLDEAARFNANVNAPLNVEGD
ncbi:acyl-CoA dehydrogenase N-terminal domain-containing protein, partial [Pandoraea sp.]|uniref:acyl-CoA dehydrogenase N-terminal domain-containing protein n=1 Tax=Pandoraea sp. TaxID=1883445 RepID=UPI0035AEF312